MCYLCGVERDSSLQFNQLKLYFFVTVIKNTRKLQGSSMGRIACMHVSYPSRTLMPWYAHEFFLKHFKSPCHSSITFLHIRCSTPCYLHMSTRRVALSTSFQPESFTSALVLIKRKTSKQNVPIPTSQFKSDNFHGSHLGEKQVLTTSIMTES